MLGYFSFSAVVFISPQCVNKWDFNQVICGVPCFESSNGGIYGILDLVFNIVLPLIVIVISNITLITRVIYEKIARHQAVNWRRHRKMALQLWFVSSLYLTGWLPFTITSIIQMTLSPTFMIDQLETIFFLVYLIPLLFPFVCLGVFPEIISSIQGALRGQRWNRVIAMNTQFRTN